MSSQEGQEVAETPIFSQKDRDGWALSTANEQVSPFRTTTVELFRRLIVVVMLVGFPYRYSSDCQRGRVLHVGLRPG